MTTEKADEGSTNIESASFSETKTSPRDGEAGQAGGMYYVDAIRLAHEINDQAPAEFGEIDPRRPFERLERDAISAAIEAAREVYAPYTQRVRLVDLAGQPLERTVGSFPGFPSHATKQEVINLTINREEFDRLSSKMEEILSQVRLAEERIAKDQEEINLLKSETREALRRLRAA